MEREELNIGKSICGENETAATGRTIHVELKVNKVFLLRPCGSERDVLVLGFLKGKMEEEPEVKTAKMGERSGVTG